MSPATLRAVLAFLYTGRIDAATPPDVLVDVLVAANMLGLPRLVNLAEKVAVAERSV